MFKRAMRQLSPMDEAEMFGGIKLNPENKWVKLNKLVPWDEFEEKYTENFKSKTAGDKCKDGAGGIADQRTI